MKMMRLNGLAGSGGSPVAVGLLTAALSALAWPVRAFASELDLELPALTTTYPLFGIEMPGSQLLLAGIAVCLYGMLFGLAMYRQVKSLPAHRSMLDVSNIIWETCKTYLLQQGRLLLVLELFIGACIVYYFGVLNQQGAGKVLLILLWSVVGILGSYGVAWFGIRMNTYANSRTAFAALQGKPLPIYEIPLQAGMSIGVLLICVELIMMLVILLFVPREAAGASFLGFAIGESLGASALRIAGGIFTKIADIGSDLMKVVFKIKEDDPRNPGVIADCTGDNAGDSVGPTADGFETYGVTGVALISFIALAVIPDWKPHFLVWIFAMRVLMILTSIVAFSANGAVARARNRDRDRINFEAPLTSLVWTTSLLSIAVTFLMSYWMLANLGAGMWWKLSTIISCGTLAAALIPELTKVFTSSNSRHTREIVAATREGGASLTILSGLVAGNFSVFWMSLALAAVLYVAFLMSQLGLDQFMSYPSVFAFGLVAFGLLGMGPVTIAVDSYGPVTDNAQSIFELSQIETTPGSAAQIEKQFGFKPDFAHGKHLLEDNDGAVRPRRHRLDGGPGEPVDHRPTGNEPEEKLRVKHRKVGDEVGPQPVGEKHDDGKDHRRRAGDRGADQNRLGSRLEGVPRPVVFFEEKLRPLEVHRVAVGLLDLLLDARDLLDHGKLVDRLGVVRDGPVGVHRDRDRSHPEEPERNESKGEHGGRDHEVADTQRAHSVGDAHEGDDGEPQPVRAEVSRHQSGKDVQRSPAFAGRGHDLADVLRLGRRENLHQLRYHRSGERPAGDDRSELPPERAVAEIGDERVGRDVSERHRNAGSDPHEVRERRFEVHLLSILVEPVRDPVIDQIGKTARQDHQDAHGEDPDEELDLDDRIGDCENDEGYERHAGDAVGLEPVRRGTHRIAGVVTGAIGDHAGVARVVLLDLEHDLHEIGSDVGDLGKDTASDPQGGRAERLADGEPNETWPRPSAGDEEEDAEHHEELDADKSHSDAHPRLEGDGGERKWLTGEARERRPGVRLRVDANPEPRDTVAPRDPDKAEGEDHRHAKRLEAEEDAEVEQYDDPDKDLEDEEKLPLSDEIGLARLPDELGDLAHRRVDGEFRHPHVVNEAKNETQDRDEEAPHEKPTPIHPEKAGLREIRHDEACLAPAPVLRFAGRGRGRRAREEPNGRREQDDRKNDKVNRTRRGSSPRRQQRRIHDDLSPKLMGLDARNIHSGERGARFRRAIAAGRSPRHPRNGASGSAFVIPPKAPRRPIACSRS